MAMGKSSLLGPPGIRVTETEKCSRGDIHLCVKKEILKRKRCTYTYTRIWQKWVQNDNLRYVLTQYLENEWVSALIMPGRAGPQLGAPLQSKT